MLNKNLDYRIIIEISDKNIEIDNLDVDFFITKNCKLEPDKAYLKIWNLDDTMYNLILMSNSAINLFLKANDMPKMLLFSGVPELSSVSRRNVMVPDLLTTIKLLDSSNPYLNSYINKNYIGMVSSTRIITDCIEAMGLKVRITDISAVEKFYNSYKAKGQPHIILRNICESLGLHLFIQNGLVRSLSGFDFRNISVIKEFNQENASSPFVLGTSEFSFYSDFLPYSQPADIIRCSFDEITGLYFISEISTEGNNYNKMCVTKVTVGL